jgi:hypothetical protein
VSHLRRAVHFFVAQSVHPLTVKRVQIPFEWQENVIRACITLKLLTYQETGAIVAAATTSIPREAQSKLQDLRYCRVEDMPHIIRTLNRYLQRITVPRCVTHSLDD